jgi:hypothetical protein
MPLCGNAITRLKSAVKNYVFKLAPASCKAGLIAQIKTGFSNCAPASPKEGLRLVLKLTKQV